MAMPTFFPLYPGQKMSIGAIEAFANFGCIATGILQIIALNFHETIWKKYARWLRTVTATVPSEEVVKSVIQQAAIVIMRFRFVSVKQDATQYIISSKNLSR
ncbi:hypothetical protein [Desulfosarcina ovata]|uniref:Uncharacterized protein n=1 Tax=Desulfosarcina ovata subsp. ovata TaxID=2752305 RepID=A0A5K8AKJ2_9BACT|nr:hypothetical protein [Desulfosarcina ovata]BBO93211.1 hypothetical protein DSCOOX_63910 [Desulfosarcina ovata subsp. ovata]